MANFFFCLCVLHSFAREGRISVGFSKLVLVSQNLRICHCVAGQRRTKELLSNISKTSLHYKYVTIQLSQTASGRHREREREKQDF